MPSSRTESLTHTNSRMCKMIAEPLKIPVHKFCKAAARHVRAKARLIGYEFSDES
jgi:hypothetical protein